MVNYEVLLGKYVIHVGQCEGTTFISNCNSKHHSDVEFTKEEIEVLKKLDW